MSLDIRSPGVFAETFLDHYHLDICKSNAKTHKIISINRFGITCCYFSSRNIPAVALFAATFLSNLVLSRSNQCFGCGLDQSHCRKLHIQIWLWPGLILASGIIINRPFSLYACSLCPRELFLSNVVVVQCTARVGGVMYDPREVESHFRYVITNTI